MSEYSNFDIRKFLSKYGPLDQRQKVSDGICSEYDGKLPPDLIDFWRQNGIGTWLGGKFQFCIPSYFVDVMKLAFDEDPEIDFNKTHVVGYSAFGELLVWNEELQTCKINLRKSSMSVGLWDYSEFDVKNMPLAVVISGLDLERTYRIAADRPGYASLFDEAVDLIGSLKLGQCYGFFPALALGGAEKIKHVQIVDAQVHFALLAQMGPLRIRQLTERDEIEFIRYAGKQ